MNKREFAPTKESLLERMRRENYSPGVLEKTNWVLDHFKNYCDKQELEEITISAASDFVLVCFGFDMFRPAFHLQATLRHPLLIFFEFSTTGQYAKKHHQLNSVDIPQRFLPLFYEFSFYVEGCGYNKSTRLKRLLIFARYVKYLDESGIQSTLNATKQSAYGFIKTLDGFAPKTRKGYKTDFRFLLNWLYQNGHALFSGHEILEVIHSEDRSVLVSYYTQNEISTILKSIDTDTTSGKFEYSILSFFIYLGLRESDVASLRFSNIDWNRSLIFIEQFKTKQSLTLPLLDEVKYPLLDYLKNARPESEDKEHIFIRRHAPCTCYPNGAALYNIVSRCIRRSGIETKGRHLGPHALRHSLATNLLSEEVPLSAVSDILGHSSVLTTEIYLTVDETHLKELSLEVPGHER